MCFDVNVYNPLLAKNLIKGVRRLSRGIAWTGGRSKMGRITAFKKGGALRRRLVRFIDFWRRLRVDIYIINVELDYLRTTPITVVAYTNGHLAYLVLPRVYSIGEFVKFGAFFHWLDAQVDQELHKRDLPLGIALPIKYIPRGVAIFNIELWPAKGAQICRSAGTSAVIVSHRGKFSVLKLRSGWKIVVSSNNIATVGAAPSFGRDAIVYKKAGFIRNHGRRPTVRGVAMNAVDHPHGGGRGKTSGGPVQRTPWGRPAKFTATVAKRIRRNKSHVIFR